MSIPSDQILRGAISRSNGLSGSVNIKDVNVESRQELKGAVSSDGNLTGNVAVTSIIKPDVDPELVKEFVNDYIRENPPEPGKTPVKGVDYFTEEELRDVVEESAKLVTIVDVFSTDETLTLDPVTKILSVNTATEADENNTLPITAAAVATQIGNIEILLKTI